MDERLNREVALKVFRPGASADTARRFGTEARLLARLRHPGLIEVYAYGVVADRPYLALELLRGPALAALLRAAPMHADRVRRLGRELATALAHVHSHGSSIGTSNPPMSWSAATAAPGWPTSAPPASSTKQPPPVTRHSPAPAWSSAPRPTWPRNRSAARVPWRQPTSTPWASC
ncbi:protein kinase [Kitasatospora sp. DSM 101779]|nr:protein kinase [Kitasatospora sp. DSM 101779]